MDPGWVHDLIGSVALKTVQAVMQRKGYRFSIGDVELTSLVPESMKEDGPQPNAIAARVAAHLGHRIPGIRRFEKRAEGKDKSSGLLSDIGVLIGQLYYRNKETVNELVAEAVSKKLTSKKSGRKGTPAPDSHVDFGGVGVPVEPDGGLDDA